MESLTGGFPTCFEKAGWGTNAATYDQVSPGRTGAVAERITMTAVSSGDRKTLLAQSACAPQVVAGHRYELSVYYQGSTPNLALTVFKHTAVGWSYYLDLASAPVSAAWSQLSAVTPPIPAGVDRIAFGISIYGVGQVTTDDYSAVDVTVAPEAVCTGGVECTQGRWDIQPAPSPVRAIHSVLLRDGRVLMVAGSGNDADAFAAGTFRTTVWNPATGQFTAVPTPVDLFCSGHVQLADGRVLIMGGTKSYPVPNGHGYEGLVDSYAFDPATNRYTRLGNLNVGHWYPSATQLGNGDVLTLGGLNETSGGTVETEYFSAAQNRWLTHDQVRQTYSFWGLYPSMILMQDGRLFYTGSHVFGNSLPGTGASIYDYAGGTITDVPGLRRKDERDQSASVLLPPAQAQKVATFGGGNVATNVDAHRLTDVIDLSLPDPAYTPGPDLPHGTLHSGPAETGAQGKMYVSAVILPDGTVFETGGALHNRADPVREASRYDPVTNVFTPMAPDPVPRGYHSEAILLPDGRVLAVGDNPGDGSFDLRMSVYSPPYLFHGNRPVITSAATEWHYGNVQPVGISSTSSPASATLIRPAAVTHSSDPNQRSVSLPVTVDPNGTSISLNVTTNANLAPPGWYMLFVTDGAGTPSIARWVHLT
jgi:hypothetical protein